MAEASKAVTVALKLDSTGLKQTAVDSVNALDALKKSIASDTREINELKKAMKNLQGGAVVDVKLFKRLKASLDAKSSSLAKAQGDYIALGGSLKDLSKKSRAQVSAFSDIRGQAQMLPGPIGAIASNLGLVSQVGKGTMGVSLGLAAAMIAVSAAVGIATVSLLKYGIASQDARRSEALHLEGLTKIRTWYRTAAMSAGELQTAIDNVASATPLPREKVAAYAEELYRAGLRGKSLGSALEGVAIKASVQGDAQAGLFKDLAVHVGRAGGAVDKMAQAVKNRLGGVAAKQMLSLDVQAKKLAESYGMLFGGLKIEKMLEAKKLVNDLFSQSTATGRALKQLLSVLLQPLINALAEAAPLAKRFFQGMVIAAQRLIIPILELRIWFRKTFGTETVQAIDSSTAALNSGKVAVVLLTSVMGGLAVATATAFWPFVLGAAAVLGVIKAIELLYVVWREIDWSGLGRSITDGIIQGIGWNAVKDTVVSLATGARDWFKDVLGIHSPSKVFAELGKNLPEGLTVGIEAGRPDVQRSIEHLVTMPKVDMPQVASQPSAAASDTASAGDMSFMFAEGSIVINAKDKDGAATIATGLRDELQKLLSTMVLQRGGAV